jgi:hypothetical protein
MGGINSGRVGGNPDIIKNRFTTDNPKPYKVTVAFDKETFEFLKTLGAGRTDFIRASVKFYLDSQVK